MPTAGMSPYSLSLQGILKSHRVQDYEVHAYVYGREFLKIPKSTDPNSKTPQCFWLSRDAYERLLRRLVLESSKRIRWMTGTVTNVNLDTKDASVLSSVTVRLPDGQERDIPAALVLGLIFAFSASR